MSGSPEPDEYAFKEAGLARLEQLSEQGHIDLFYGDESGVSLVPCVPYGWQFKNEKVSLPSTQGAGVNCFALLSRQSECWFRTTEQAINASVVINWLDAFAQSLKRITVVVLDNAPVHQARKVRKHLAGWRKRGLYVFYLPSYSPHLNLAEVLWRKLKYEWLRAEDYADKEALRYSVWQALAAVGTAHRINFSAYKKKIT